MPEQLFYGEGRSLRLAWRHSIDVLWCDAPRIAPVADARVAARRAVEAPIDYPPLSALLAPEDRVAIAVEPGVPEASAIVRGVIDALAASGVERGQITVLRASPAPLGSGVREISHRADDTDALAYLAATDDAQPIYLNRVLYDADVVIPIGLRRPNHSYGYLGSPGGIYPLFADDAAQFRSLATGPVDWRRHGRARRWEADRVAWQLGLQFRIEAVPAARGRLAHVIGGQTDSVTRHARRLMLDAWGQRLSDQVGIAIAGVGQLPSELASSELTSSDLVWGDIQRAFYAASRLVVDQGVIVVCSNVNTPPLPVRRPARRIEDGDSTADADPDADDEFNSDPNSDSDFHADDDSDSYDPMLDESAPRSGRSAGRSTGRRKRDGAGSGDRGKVRDESSRKTGVEGPRMRRQGARGRYERGRSEIGAQARKAKLRREEIQPVRELLAELGESRRLYLLSDLPRDLVEELGCVPVETADEIALLARPFDTGVVIADAEYAHVSLAREDE
jgi:hypothetical protein